MFDWGSNAGSDNPRTVWPLTSHSITLNVLLSLKNHHSHLAGMSRHGHRESESASCTALGTWRLLVTRLDLTGRSDLGKS